MVYPNNMYDEMEIYQIALMVIGAITLVWLSYKVLKGFV